MDYLLVIIAGILVIVGIVGCVIPVLPGPPLSYIGIILLHFTQWGNLSTKLLIWLGILAVTVTVIDFLLPVWTTKKFGGSKYGAYGATIGLVIGLFFAPLGIIICPFVGAFASEMIFNKDSNKALRSAIGSFIGFLLGTGAKFAVSGLMLYYYVVELFII